MQLLVDGSVDQFTHLIGNQKIRDGQLDRPFFNAVRKLVSHAFPFLFCFNRLPFPKLKKRNPLWVQWADRAFFTFDDDLVIVGPGESL